jgi:hypothetical protein
MKKKMITFYFLAVLCSALNAQTTATFENLSLSANSYFDGSTSPGGTTFASGNIVLENYYDNAWLYWASGWAYSNMKDSATAGYGNLFSARPANGNANSANYAIGQQGAKIKFNATAEGKVVHGFFITNSTYAALSMRDGDSFAKKFGGSTGDDPDWFKLTVHAWYGGNIVNDSVEFYLADFRFANNSMDYIVNDWQWVNLSSLGNSDSLVFSLSSSDIGSFGMNTPAFFCLDDLTTTDSPLAVNENTLNKFMLYPNPSSDFIQLENNNTVPSHLVLTDLNGNKILEKEFEKNLLLDIRFLKTGIYLVTVTNENSTTTKKITKL